MTMWNSVAQLLETETESPDFYTTNPFWIRLP